MKDNYIFHPFELSFCGYSNTGKTTLISSLTERLSSRYQIGYIKHDAHRFEMDKEGKDTWKLTRSGARFVSINDADKWAILSQGEVNSLLRPYEVMNCDFLFVEGFKSADMDKIVILNDDLNILEDIQDHSRIIAFIAKEKSVFERLPFELKKGRFFCLRDEVGKIEDFILNYFLEKANSYPLYGLVLAGGHSTRMRTDKSKLVYREGKTQLECCVELLRKRCVKTFVSCRKEQSQNYPYNLFKIITDQFLDLGPMGGILSAMKSTPGARWLVLACDLPFLDDQVLSELIEKRDPFKMATTYENKEGKRLEPLCTIYSPWAFPRLMQMIGIGKNCPQKFLWNAPVKVLELKKPQLLANANTPESFREAKEKIKNSIQE